MNSTHCASRTVADPEALAPDMYVPAYWDPAEELAHLLQADTAEKHLGEAPLNPGSETELTAEGVGVCLRPSGHRRVRRRRPRPSLLQTASFLIAAVACAFVAMVSVLSGLVAYDPLYEVVAAPARSGADRWWPLLVYGPWTVASLSILRAAMHGRRAMHAWCVVLSYSAVATALCIAHAPQPFPDAAAAALPTIAALTCFRLLVCQITLTRPPRRSAARHRGAVPSSK